jgi:hypothetical protein
MSWVEDSARKADGDSEVVVLENPVVRDRLDRHILEIWPAVRTHLEQTGYVFTPTDEVGIRSEGSRVLVRSMSWMIHDVSGAVYRGILECGTDHWMLKSEFFLSMPAEVDVGLLLEIVGNTRLSGNPPELTVHKHDSAGFYQVKFMSGRGESWWPGSRDRILQRIRECIDTNVELHEFAMDGELTRTTVEAFLSRAYDVYESY